MRALVCTFIHLSHEYTSSTSWGYLSASLENPFAPPVAGWPPSPQAAGSAMQRSEADWAGWVWVNLDPCKVRCMSMLWRERQEQGRRSGEPGTCPAPASICQQATCWSSPGPPSATCGFSPRLLSVTLDHLGPLQDTALAHLRAINSTIPPEISVQ